MSLPDRCICDRGGVPEVIDVHEGHVELVPAEVKVDLYSGASDRSRCTCIQDAGVPR